MSKSEMLDASGPGRGQVEVGMEVRSIDGETLGTVKEVHDDEFLVDRSMARDLWVPMAAILATPDMSQNVHGPVQPSAVVLEVSAAHVDSQGWRQD